MLDDPAVLLGRLDHLAAFEDVVAARLLDVDVLARLAGPDRRQRVPVVRRGDADHVDVLAVVDLAEVGLGLGLVAVLLLELARPARRGRSRSGSQSTATLTPLVPMKPSMCVLPRPLTPEHRGADGVVRPLGRRPAPPGSPRPPRRRPPCRNVLRFTSDIAFPFCAGACAASARWPLAELKSRSSLGTPPAGADRLAPRRAGTNSSGFERPESDPQLRPSAPQRAFGSFG